MLSVGSWRTSFPWSLDYPKDGEGRFMSQLFLSSPSSPQKLSCIKLPGRGERTPSPTLPLGKGERAKVPSPLPRGKDRIGVNPPHLSPLPPGERKLSIKKCRVLSPQGEGPFHSGQSRFASGHTWPFL